MTDKLSDSELNNSIIVNMKDLVQIDNAINSVNEYFRDMDNIDITNSYVKDGLQIISDSFYMLVSLESSIRTYDKEIKTKLNSKNNQENMVYQKIEIPEDSLISAIEYCKLNPLSFICSIQLSLSSINNCGLSVIQIDPQDSYRNLWKRFDNLKNEIYMFRKLLSIKNTGEPVYNHKFIHFCNSTIH